MLAKGKAPKVEFASERMEPAAYIPEGSGPADFVQGARHKARKGILRGRKWFSFWTNTISP